MSSAPSPRLADASGFSLPELLITMALMMLVLGGTLAVMSDTVQSQQTAKDMLDLNGTLRASVDLMQRDLMQAGGGLPTGQRLGIPSGPSVGAIARPGPAASAGCAGVGNFPADSSLPAIVVGPDLGPAVNGSCTDVITVFLADAGFTCVDEDAPNLPGDVTTSWIKKNGTEARIDDCANLSDDPDVDGNNVRPGDLLLFMRQGSSVLTHVTSVSGQTVRFSPSDSLNLNNHAASSSGTMRTLAETDPSAAAMGEGGDVPLAATVRRIRMITYFINTAIDPNNPRLMRAVNGGTPQAVGFGVDRFRITYDIVDSVLNPAGVRMTPADLDGTGACDDPGTTDENERCSPNQIRKVNLAITMRAVGDGGQSMTYQGNATHNTLFAQVSLRNMAFVDRYR